MDGSLIAAIKPTANVHSWTAHTLLL